MMVNKLIQIKLQQLSLLASCILLFNCSKTFLDVEIQTFQIPVERYQELSTLIVVFDQDLPQNFRNDFQQKFATCSPFSQIKYHQEAVDFAQIKRGGTQDYLKSYLLKNNNLQQYHGIIMIDAAHQKLDNNLERSTAYRYIDQANYQWFPNYASPSSSKHGYGNRFELAPERKTASQSILIRNHIYEYRIQ